MRAPASQGRLKGAGGSDDNSGMKTCPHCGGEIKPSVIRCVHCGASLLDEPEPSAVPVGAVARSTPVAATSPAPGTARPLGATSATPTAPVRSVFDPPTPRPGDEPPAAPSVNGHTSLPTSSEVEERPADTRARRLDRVLMASGVLAIVSAVLAFSALSLPWMTGRLSVIGGRGNARPVADLTFRASDSLAAPLVLGAAIATTLVGVLWFWYGMERGTLPALVTSGLAAVAGLMAVGVLIAWKTGSLFGQGAFIEHARNAGLTKEAMRSLLQAQPAPVTELEPLGGVTRFALAAALIPLAGVVAWWSQRRRGSAAR